MKVASALEGLSKSQTPDLWQISNTVSRGRTLSYIYKQLYKYQNADRKFKAMQSYKNYYFTNEHLQHCMWTGNISILDISTIGDDQAKL